VIITGDAGCAFVQAVAVNQWSSFCSMPQSIYAPRMYPKYGKTTWPLSVLQQGA
jgi:hypothetical protein